MIFDVSDLDILHIVCRGSAQVYTRMLRVPTTSMRGSLRMQTQRQTQKKLPQEQDPSFHSSVKFTEGFSLYNTAGYSDYIMWYMQGGEIK